MDGISQSAGVAACAYAPHRCRIGGVLLALLEFPLSPRHRLALGVFRRSSLATLPAFLFGGELSPCLLALAARFGVDSRKLRAIEG